MPLLVEYHQELDRLALRWAVSDEYVRIESDANVPGVKHLFGADDCCVGFNLGRVAVMGWSDRLAEIELQDCPYDQTPLGYIDEMLTRASELFGRLPTTLSFRID